MNNIVLDVVLTPRLVGQTLSRQGRLLVFYKQILTISAGPCKHICQAGAYLLVFNTHPLSLTGQCENITTTTIAAAATTINNNNNSNNNVV